MVQNTSSAKGAPLRSQQFDDVYFSAQDGLAETTHVFIEGNDLVERFSNLTQNTVFTIAETGFGTGLNFLASAKVFEAHAPDGAKLHFISYEKFPLGSAEIADALEPWDGDLAPHRAELARVYTREGGIYKLSPRITLTLHMGDVNDMMPGHDYAADAWFLDGFKPSSNPDMWSQTVLGQVARLSRHGTTLASFTAAGFVRRGLQDAGFAIEKRPGFGRKREMITGVMRND